MYEYADSYEMQFDVYALVNFIRVFDALICHGRLHTSGIVNYACIEYIIL
jgi:hypothetical protein